MTTSSGFHTLFPQLSLARDALSLVPLCPHLHFPLSGRRVLYQFRQNPAVLDCADRIGVAFCFSIARATGLFLIDRGPVAPPFPLIDATLQTMVPQIAEIEEP